MTSRSSCCPASRPPSISEASARAVGARCSLMSTQLTDLGFGRATPSDVAELDPRHPIVFEQLGRSSGSLRVYDLASVRP